MEISKEIREKGLQLFKNGKVKKELETSKRIHFKVFGETETHSVIFDKKERKYVCDCKFATLQGKTCSHILASELWNSA